MCGGREWNIRQLADFREVSAMMTSLMSPALFYACSCLQAGQSSMFNSFISRSCLSLSCPALLARLVVIND